MFIPNYDTIAGLYSLGANHVRILVEVMERRSPIWQFYSVCGEDKGKAMCMLCKAVISRGGGITKSFTTSPLNNHLSHKHPEEFKLVLSQRILNEKAAAKLTVNGNSETTAKKRATTNDTNKTTNNIMPAADFAIEDDTGSSPVFENVVEVSPDDVVVKEEISDERTVLSQQQLHWAAKKRVVLNNNVNKRSLPVRKYFTKKQMMMESAAKEAWRPTKSLVVEKDDEFGHFGANIGCRIRNLATPYARSMAQHLIANLIFEFEMGRYNSPANITNNTQDG